MSCRFSWLVHWRTALRWPGRWRELGALKLASSSKNWQRYVHKGVCVCHCVCVCVCVCVNVSVCVPIIVMSMIVYKIILAILIWNISKHSHTNMYTHVLMVFPGAYSPFLFSFPSSPSLLPLPPSPSHTHTHTLLFSAHLAVLRI